MLRGLAVLVCLVTAVAPLSARASLYINGQNVRVQDKKLSSGCELTNRAAAGDHMMCTDREGYKDYSWHNLQLSSMAQPSKTCELHTILQHGSGYHQYRWHAELRNNRAQCTIYWQNNNTLDVKSNAR